MRMSLLLFVTTFLIISACSTTEKRFSPDDLLISPGEPVPDPPHLVSAKEVSEDISFLLYALERGYSGKDYLPARSYQSLVERLKSISGSQSPDSLRDRIDEVLTDTPDNHLNAKIKGKASSYRVATSALGNVGKNFFAGDFAHPWAIKKRKLNRKRTALLISVVSFPSHESSAWKGFLEEVEKELPRADAAVIDLRGNGGGDDTIGDELAWLFYGRNFEVPVLQQPERITPEAHALYVNMYSYQMARNLGKGIRSEEFLSQHYQKTLQAFERAKAMKPDGYFIKPVGIFKTDRVHSKNTAPFDKPIFILMDRACDSSCESTIDAFEFLPQVTKVGENTGGYLHFGNVSDVILPHSKIVVQMGTHFTQYADGRFVEKVGISPNIKVAKAEDALEVTLKQLDAN